jgi:hypothetical protein
MMNFLQVTFSMAKQMGRRTKAIELYASYFFNGKTVISHATSPYPAQTHPRRWVLNHEARNP